MTNQADDLVRKAASALSETHGTTEERGLLEALAARMKIDESSFDPAHGLAKILPASNDHGEVRLTADGVWKIGSAPEKDLLAVWGTRDAPPLAHILAGVQERFSSAKVSALVTEVKESLSL